MSSIFISHSSRNNLQALAIKQWLADNGWDDVFLDIDTQKGIHPGEQWKNALSAAASRCQAVLCLVSKDWLSSAECKVEFRHTEYLGKRAVTVFLEPCEEGDFTSTWQRCNLYGDGDKETIHFQLNGQPEQIEFNAEGLARLKHGLKDAGLDADYFMYDINRPPYPGFRPLEFADAAIFFGRDSAIIRALDALQGLRKRDVEPLLVILGASGAGKSSFLRAGLLPRLARDERNFFALPIIRPERAAISGKNGLLNSIEQAFYGLKQPKNRGDIRLALESPTGFKSVLQELQTLLLNKVKGNDSPPALLFAIDQAEELFGPDNQNEAHLFIELLTDILAPTAQSNADKATSFNRPFAVLTIRSDSYQRLQNDPKLGLIQPYLFSLPPIAREEYKLIIEQPAKRYTAAGGRLKIEPALTERLLQETEGADALPLLAFTLERLLLEHGADGLLSIDDYELLGGIGGSIEAAIQTALADPKNDPEIPQHSEECERLLRMAFIPWLAYIDPDSEERKRRVARWDEIPAAARPLLERLIRQRLLVRDFRRVAGSSVDTVVVEVAHEALLRRWPTLSEWLDQDATAIKTLFAAKRSATEWQKSARNTGWLLHADERLTAVEALLQRAEFEQLLEDEGRAYIRACRQKQDDLLAEELAQQQKAQTLEQKRLEAEQLAERERLKLIEAQAQQATERAESNRRLFQRTAFGAALAVFFAAGAVLFAFKANNQETAAKHALGTSNALEAGRRYADGQKSQALAYLAKAVRLDPSDSVWRTHLTGILLGNGWCPLKAVLNGREPTSAAIFSPDAASIVTLAGDEALIWDATNGKRLGAALRHRNTVNSAAFNPDGSMIVTASTDRYVRLWDSHTGLAKRELIRHASAVKHASFSADGNRVITRTRTEMRVFDTNTGAEIGKPVVVDFSDKQHFLFRTKNQSIIYWNADTGSQIGPEITNVGRIQSALFAPDGKRLAIQFKEGLRIIDTATGKDVFPLLDIAGLRPEAFSADGSKLLLSGKDFNTALLDIQTTTVGDKKVYPNANADYKPQLSPDGKRLLLHVKARHENDKVFLIDTKTWKGIGKTVDGAWLALPGFCGESQRAISFAEKQVYLHNTDTGELLLDGGRMNAGINSAGFSSDCRLMYVIAGHEARIWDAQTGYPLGQSLTHPAPVLSAAFSPNNGLFVTTTALGAHVWETKAGAATGEVPDFIENANMIAVSAAGNRLMTVNGPKARLWDFQTGKQLAGEAQLYEGIKPPYDTDPVPVLDRMGKHIMLIDDKSTVHIWDAESNFKPLKPFSLSQDYYDSEALTVISSTGRYMLTTLERIAKIWELNSGKSVSKTPRHNDRITSATFSEDDKYLVTTSNDSTAKIWNPSTGEQLGKTLYHDGNKVYSASFDKQGARLLTVALKAIPVGRWTEDLARTIRVWLTESGAPLAETLTFDENISSASLSPDGERILVAFGSSAQIYDVFSSKPIGEKLIHDQQVTSARFNADATQVLTTSGSAAFLWNAQRSNLISEPLAAPEPLRDAYFLADGEHILTVSQDQPSIARLWDIPNGDKSDAELLASLAETISGYTVSAFGTLNAVPNRLSRLAGLQNDLKDNNTSASAKALAEWLLADPWQRTLSPTAHMTVIDYLKNDKLQSGLAKKLYPGWKIVKQQQKPAVLKGKQP